MRIRYLIITVVVVVVVLVAGIALLLSNVDKYRPRVQAELQKKLDRPVTIGQLGLKLFPLSIRANGLTIAESPVFPSSRPFATAKELFVSVGLFSLIRGNPEVRDVILDQPQIELVRNRAGVWNYSTLGGSSQSSNSNSQISLDKLQINNGQVALTDQVTNQPRSVYNGIDLKLTDFAPGKKFGLDAAVHFPGSGKQLLSFNGKVGPLEPGNSAATPVNGHLSLDEVSLAAVNRFAAGTLPDHTDATASGAADVSSQGNQLSAKGDLKLQNAVIRGSKLNFPVNARYDLSADRAQNVLHVHSGTVDLGSTSFTLAGDVDSAKTPANLNVQVGTKNSSITELAKLAGAFGVAFNPAYQVKGFVTADLTAKGPTTAPQLAGSISAKQLEASGGEIKQPVSVPEIDLALTPDSVRSNTFTARSGSTNVTGNFTLTQYSTPNSIVDATLKTENANIAELVDMAKAYGASANGMTGTGRLSADIHVQGPTSKSSELNYSGTAAISAATLSTPELTKPASIASAQAQFSKNSVVITNLAAAIGSTSVRGNLSARDFAAPDVQFALSADKIDTAELENLPSKQAPAKRAGTSKATAKEPSLIDTMTGSGTLAANTIKAEEIVLNNFHANVKLNKGLVTLSPISTDIFGGKENGTLALDLRPATTLCSVNAKFAGVDTNALLSAVSSAKNTLYGSLAADTNLRFALLPSTELPQTLNGTVAFNVTNGQLKNVNILNELAKVGKFLGNTPAQAGSGTALRKFAGTLNLTNGLAATNNMTAVLDAGSLSATGTMNLVSQALDMHMNAVLASSTSQSVGGKGIGGYLNTALANNKGELVIPVVVTGTMAHPTFTPDMQALAKMKLNNLLPSVSDPAKLTSAFTSGKGVGGILNGVLGGGQAPAQQGKAQPNAQQNQQDTLNSLFNQFGKKKKKQ